MNPSAPTKINLLKLNRFSRIRFRFSQFQAVYTVLWRLWNLCCRTHSTQKRYHRYHPNRPRKCGNPSGSEHLPAGIAKRS